MSLSNYRMSAQIAVSDLARAAQFYEGKLGLRRAGDEHAGTLTYTCGNGAFLHIYELPAHAGKTSATLGRWDILDDLERIVDELTAKGIAFEHYGEPVKTDSRGVHDSGYGKVAWFKDPDGNTFALEQC
jgi:catechol 2,3-dioxygenase-like lactoylglutathione lyase family enzyme